MTRHNPSPTPEYRDLVERIREAAAEDPDRAVRAVADGLEAALVEQFRTAYGVDRRADRACLGRLVAGWDRCRHRGDRTDPPHHPPGADHQSLWLADGDPAAFSMHCYDVRNDHLEAWLDLADHWGLVVEVDPASWYFPNRTVHVVFSGPERTAESGRYR